MRIKRKDLNLLVKKLLFEVGSGVGMDSTGSTMPRGMKRSEYKQLEDASTDPHNIMAAISIVDPTMAADVADAIIYYLEGKPEEAAAVLALSAAGLGAGALAVKLGKGFKAAGKNADEATEMGRDLAEKAKVKASDDGIEYTFKKISNDTLTKYNLNIVKPESRQLKIIHGSSASPDDISGLVHLRTKGGGMVTRQSKKGKLMSGFYTYPSSMPGKSNQEVIKRASKYGENIYEFNIIPKANFVKSTNSFAWTRITPSKWQELYDSGIDILITVAESGEEIIIINPDVLSNPKLIK